MRIQLKSGAFEAASSQMVGRRDARAVMNSMALAQFCKRVEHESRPDAPMNPRGFGERIENLTVATSAD